MKKMKFLLGALSFMAAAFMASPSQAQVKTYFSEDFEASFEASKLDGEVWNLLTSTNIASTVGPVFLLNDGTSARGTYIYDPNGIWLENGVSIAIHGVYELVSRPFLIESGLSNYLSIDFSMLTDSAVPDRVFGVRLRESGSTIWDTLQKVLLDKETADSGWLLPLDAKWDGKNVEMSTFFYNNHNPKRSFVFFMDNILVAGYSKTPYVYTQLAAPLVTYGQNCEVGMSIKNASTDTIKNVEYLYTIDGTKEHTFSVNFSKGLGWATTESHSTTIDFTDLTTGSHTLKMFPSKINGNTVEIDQNDTTVWEFILADETLLTQDYVPLMECFTASWCGPCASLNRYLNITLGSLRNENKINVIKYQSYGDKYYLSAGDVRCAIYSDYYNYGYIPFPIYNGESNIITWGRSYSSIMSLLETRATEDHAQKAFTSIEITKAKADDDKGELELSFSVTAAFTGKASVFAAVTEKTTTGNMGTNGEKEFHWVAMDMPTTGRGKLVAFEAGETQHFDYTVNLNRTHMEEITDLEVVCFVQDLESRQIFQSASANVQTDAANEGEVMGDVRVYPNPASEFVNITNLDGADVEIFDLTGRRVYANSKVEGNLEIALTSFANGTYVVRLTKDGQSAHRKLIVVR